MAEDPKPLLDQRFALAMRAARMGSWSWDIASGTRRVGRAHVRAVRHGPRDVRRHVRAWEARLHPDDREWVAREIVRAVEERRPFRFDHRCVWPDGSVHWLEGVGEMVFDERRRGRRRNGRHARRRPAAAARRPTARRCSKANARRALESEQARQRAERLQLISAGLARGRDPRRRRTRRDQRSSFPSMGALAGRRVAARSPRASG